MIYFAKSLIKKSLSAKYSPGGEWTDTGPRFANLRAKQQQQIQQELEANWSQYIIHFIPEHAVIFDPKGDGNTLILSGRWIKFEDDKARWVEILWHNRIP